MLMTKFMLAVTGQCPAGIGVEKVGAYAFGHAETVDAPTATVPVRSVNVPNIKLETWQKPHISVRACTTHSHSHMVHTKALEVVDRHMKRAVGTCPQVVCLPLWQLLWCQLRCSSATVRELAAHEDTGATH